MKKIISNKIYDIHISLLRELHDLLKEKAKNLDIILFIQRGITNDMFINKYLDIELISENFTIIRTRDQLHFMLGCLYINWNMIVYASEYKHSISNDIYFLVNPDPNSKNKVLKHIKIKEYMKLKDHSKMLKLIQRVTPNVVNLT